MLILNSTILVYYLLIKYYYFYNIYEFLIVFQGITLVRELIDAYGLDVVQAYMGHIQQNAELAVREMLRDISHISQSQQLTAVDYMDDGTPIQLTVTIDADTGSALCDFRYEQINIVPVLIQ